MFILVGTSLATTGGVPAAGTAEQVIGFQLRDTSVHTYRTDPQYFRLLNIFPSAPPYSSLGVWVYNSTDQQVSVQLIGNIDQTQSFPDYSIGSSFTTNSGQANLAVYSVDQVVSPYIGVQLSASTAPSSGSVIVLLYAVPRAD
jgi:hypothetical protein